ncbi:MAG: Clp protease N-terminal domain-containing protein [Vulcanimicrobiota bacterium]
MTEGTGQCFFCGKPERKGIRLLRYETGSVCEECLAEFAASSPFSFSDYVLNACKESSTDNPVTRPSDHAPAVSRKPSADNPALSSSSIACPPSSKKSAEACDISEASDSHFSMNKEGRIIVARARETLGRAYESIAFEIVKLYFPRRPVTIRARVYEEEMTLHRSMEISVQGTFIADELEATEFMLRRNLGLAEGDTISVVSTGHPEIFDAVLPSERRWVFLLADMKREEAEKLLAWNVHCAGRERDAVDKERIAAEIADIVGEALRANLDNYSHPAVLCRYALVTALSGYYDRCRQALFRIPGGSPLSAETTNILAMIEAEDKAGKGAGESIRILRRELLALNARTIIGEVLRFNLALLLEEAGELRSAEELYRRIFERDWHFLDVRERLGRLSPEGIASAGCAKNLRIIRRALSHWHSRLGSYPENIVELAPAWISSVPVCPASGIAYDYDKTSSSFRIWCSRCQSVERAGETGQSAETEELGHIDSSPSDSEPDIPSTERPAIDSGAPDHPERESHNGQRITADEAPEHYSGDSAGETLKLSMDEAAVKAIATACAEAGKMKVSHVGTEHLLLGILRTATGRIARILKKSGVMISKIRREIRKKTGKGDEAGSRELVFTRFALDAIEEAFSLARAGAGGKVETAHLLMGLLAMKSGLACESISNSGVDIAALESEIVAVLRGEDSRIRKDGIPSKSQNAVNAGDFNDNAVEAPKVLNAAEGWKIVEAVKTEYRAVYENNYVLNISETDFRSRLELRSRTFSSSQITYDRIAGKVYYISIPISDVMRDEKGEPRIFSPDMSDRKVLEAESAINDRQLSESEKDDCLSHVMQAVRPAIYSVSLSDGGTERIAQAPSGYDFKGMLALSPCGSTLVTMMAQAGRPAAEKESPRLAFINTSAGRLTSVLFETGEVYPEDIRFGPKNEILSLIPPGDLRIFDFRGIVQHSFTLDGFVQGAAFHPKLNRVAVGMQGICIWDADSGEFRQIATFGSYPVWSPDGCHIWFRRDDSTLCSVEVNSGRVKAICSLRGVRYAGSFLSSRPVFSPCGRYLFCVLSTSSDEAQRAGICRDSVEETDIESGRDFFCIVDTVKKQIWSAPGRSQSFLWI